MSNLKLRARLSRNIKIYQTKLFLSEKEIHKRVEIVEMKRSPVKDWACWKFQTCSECDDKTDVNFKLSCHRELKADDEQFHQVLDVTLANSSNLYRRGLKKTILNDTHQNRLQHDNYELEMLVVASKVSTLYLLLRVEISIYEKKAKPAKQKKCVKVRGESAAGQSPKTNLYKPFPSNSSRFNLPAGSEVWQKLTSYKNCKKNVASVTASEREMVVRNLQFDSSSSKATKSSSKPRAIRTRKATPVDTQQPDIRETLMKVNKELEESKNVVFQKLGTLSPKKRVTRAAKSKQTVVTEESAICKTPTKSSSIKSMNLDEVKTRITGSSRLAELRARIVKFKNCEDKLEKLDNQLQEKRLESKLESPQKTPSKSFMSPTKTIQHLSPKASPARRLLFEPKEAPASPVKGSPTKAPAYQRYQSLVDTDGKALPLPYKYRFLAEIFRSIDTVAAMLYNRKETITFAKLKPAVQELVRRNFTLEHLAQIKTLYPQAYTFAQEKVLSFGTGAPDKYELVIVPVVSVDKERSGRNTPDEENVLKSAQQTHMSPSVLLELRRKFYEILLSIVKDEHEKFLLDLDPPMRIAKEKITRWHSEFDIEACREIEKAELPQPPVQDKVSSAKEVLEKANKMLNSNSRMMKAVEMLATGQIKTASPTVPHTTVTATLNPYDKIQHNVEVSIVDTPPAIPQTQKQPACTPLLKGIPMSLLEKIRAKQAQKALEMMTRSTQDNRDAVKYGRLPEMAKILRNIFVGEKKNVLTLEHAVKKLDDSYRTKLTPTELEEHIRLLCKLLPLWAQVHVVRKVDYLKVAKDYDMVKVIKRLEVLADEKV